MEPEKRPAYEPAEKLLTPPPYDPEMKRPVTILAGAVLVLLRVVVAVLQGVEIGSRLSAGSTASFAIDGVNLAPEAVRLGVTVVGVVLAVVLLTEALFAVLIYLGWNAPRVIVMVLAVLSISAAFVGWWAEGQEITVRTSLLSLALDILILLALSSRSAAAYARRKEGRSRAAA